MASFDISRVSFNPQKHYKSVRMQQGRVLTDDDWNENERIENDDRRRTIVDVIGPYGTPNDGFAISHLSISAGSLDFDIGPGTIYLGGLRLEMDSKETFMAQSDWLQQHAYNAPSGLATGEESYSMVYLEAWQQPVCAVEDSELYEVALGGPDTTTRLKNMKRVKIFDADASDCASYWQKLLDSWKADMLGTIADNYERVPAVTMQVSFTGVKITDNLCTPSLTGAYLGAENQAIRVQITGGVSTTVKGFTWGFDDASPYYRVTVVGTTVKMQAPPKDQYHWPLSQQIVELLPLAAELPNKEKVAGLSGELKRVIASYDPDLMTFTIDSAITTLDKTSFYFMRVWNRGSDITSPIQIPIPAVGSTAILGNTGLQISFNGTEVVPDDYWVIAARPDSPDKIVPWALLNPGIAPQGIHRFYAPLGIIRWTGTGTTTAPTADLIYDCRKHFRSLTEQECCCTYTVGDGVNSCGDFNKIQDAIDALPDDGGEICILRGVHVTNAKIDQLKQVHIYGCGEQSIVCTPNNNDNQIFLISNSQSIKIDNLTLVTFNGIAIDVEDDDKNGKIPSHLITIRDNRILAFIHAVRVNLLSQSAGNNIIEIVHNLIGMFDIDYSQGSDQGDVAIFTLADEVLIERNRIIVIPASDKVTPKPGQNQPHGQLPDPCDCDGELKKRDAQFVKIVKDWLNVIAAYTGEASSETYAVPGGIQVGGGSERVFVLQNTIIGGRGNGITLGTILSKDEEAAFLYDITIDGNVISEMGLSGIGTIRQRGDEGDNFMQIKGLEISGNYIRFCVQGDLLKQDPRFPTGEIPASAIMITSCEECIIRENRLEDNGTNQSAPVSAIFIFIGEDIDISNNYISNNGPNLQDQNLTNIKVRGGIVIWYAFKAPRFDKLRDNEERTALAQAILEKIAKAKRVLIQDEGTPSEGVITGYLKDPAPVFDAAPAVKIHDNIVNQPLGHALFVMALGTISVVGNQFTSQGVNKGDPFSRLAGCVLIIEIGLSENIFKGIFVPLNNMGYLNIDQSMNALGEGNPSREYGRPMLYDPIYEYLPSGEIMYSANQSLFNNSRDSHCLSAVMIFSLDDIAFVDNQSKYQTRLTKAKNGDKISFLSLGTTFNTVLFSISTRCNDNRFTDGAAYSLLSIATVSTTIGNQANHCLIVPIRGTNYYKELNIPMIEKMCERLEKLLSNVAYLPDQTNSWNAK
jgi:hypothetical protein